MYVYLLCISATLWTSSEAALKGLAIQVSQSPGVIALMRLNASAEFSCGMSGQQALPSPYGLSLRRRFHGNRKVLYHVLKDSTQTIASDFIGRVSLTGDCCNFTIQLSLLKVEDTDGYFCEWEFITGAGDVHRLESNYTLIIVRERDPEVMCSGADIVLHRLFLGLIVVVCAVMFLVFIGALVWRCLLSKGRYDPHQSSQHVPHHHRHRRRCPPPPPPPHHHHHHHQHQTHHHHVYLPHTSPQLWSSQHRQY